MFPSTTKVLAAPDSGIFLDMEPITKDAQQGFKNFRVMQHFLIAHAEVDPVNTACV